MTHHICTAFGDSDGNYGPNPPCHHPYMGVLQGSGAAGIAWTAVCLDIFAAMKSMGYGYSTRMAITTALLRLLGFAFVDDANIIHSGPSNRTSGCQVLTDMQQVLDHWDGLLRELVAHWKKARVTGTS